MPTSRVVHISPRLAAAIVDESRRCGVTIADCVDRAWVLARRRLAAIASPAPVPQEDELSPRWPTRVSSRAFGDARAEAVYHEQFVSDAQVQLVLDGDPELLAEMVEEARRLARPLGWVVERAWCINLDFEPAAAEVWSCRDFTGDTQPIIRLDSI